MYQRKVNEFLEHQTRNYQNHLELLSKFLIRERNRRLILIIDNADQFDLEVQEKVFLFANSLNRSALCGIFIALREGYYYKWRFRPPFNAFASNVYHVTAPPYSEVLQKRISYALKKVKLSEKVSGVTIKGFKLTIDNQNIIEFLHGLQSSLFDGNNQKIIDFLNYSTFPNIREGLKLFKLFLTSGYTDVHEYILRVRFNQIEAKISIPIHEFIKSIGLYNKLYYNRDISIIPNLFYPCENSSDHFLKLWILKYLLLKFEQGGNISKFERYYVLVEEFVNFGYRVDIINRTISELLISELIESDEIISDVKWYQLPEKDFNLSISPKGHYYTKELKNRFHYLDMVLQDTPIFDSCWFNKLKSVFPNSNEDGKRNIEGRKTTVLTFLGYLKDQEKIQSRALLQKLGSITEEIEIMGLNQDINQIENRFIK